MPGLGGKTIDKLLANFETEMNILHKLSEDDHRGSCRRKSSKKHSSSKNQEMCTYKPVVEEYTAN